MRKHPRGRVSVALKLSVHYFGGAGAFVPFWLSSPLQQSAQRQTRRGSFSALLGRRSPQLSTPMHPIATRPAIPTKATTSIIMG